MTKYAITLYVDVLDRKDVVATAKEQFSNGKEAWEGWQDWQEWCSDGAGDGELNDEVIDALLTLFGCGLLHKDLITPCKSVDIYACHVEEKVYEPHAKLEAAIASSSLVGN